MMHIGFGFHLELELGEAQDVITKRVAWLEKYVGALRPGGGMEMPCSFRFRGSARLFSSFS